MNNIELLLYWLKVNLFFEFLLSNGLLKLLNSGCCLSYEIKQ